MRELQERSCGAGGRLQIAVRRMASKYPFHAHLLAACDFVEDISRRTMGVTVRTGRIVILYSPTFVSNCSFEELQGVLSHEINHVLFGHVFADPELFPDRTARLIAEEVTVNEWVAELLPGNPILLEQFPYLPVGEDTRTRYLRLASTLSDRAHDGRARKICDGNDIGKVPPGPVINGIHPNSGQEAAENPTDCAKNSTDSLKPEGECTENDGQCTEIRVIVPLDDHEVWAEARATPELNRTALVVSVRKADHRLAPEQRAKLGDGLRNCITKIISGSEQGRSVEKLDLEVTDSTQISWHRVIRCYLGQLLDERPVFNRPPRRFPNMVGIAPGRGRRPGQPRVLAAVDTSASMNSEMLSLISFELQRAARRQTKVTVVEFDTEVQRYYRYVRRIDSVRGRGGTDFRPIFDAPFLAGKRPDLIVCFTDGLGPVPERRPLVPVIWCLTPGGQAPAHWGRVLRMTDTNNVRSGN